MAVYDVNEDRLTLWSSTQLAHEVRAFLMRLLQRDENQIRVVAPDVGGGFGAKFVMYPEEVAMCVAACSLRRPIKWIEDRREHFLAAVQERDQYWDLEVAFDGDGRVLGLRGELIHDQGAYTPQGLNLPYNASTGVPGPYIVPAYDLRVQVVETNKVATMPVRGAGYPEGAFAMERVLDRIARELDLDRAEVRRRNLVPAAEDALLTPLKTRAGSPVSARQRRFPALPRYGARSDRLCRVCRTPAPSARAKAAISASASATASREPGAARSNPASCGSAAPGASRSTPAPCRWGRASRPRWRKSAPSNSSFLPTA